MDKKPQAWIQTTIWSCAESFLAFIRRAIEQLGGVEVPENYQGKTDETPGRDIVDGEEPL
jgi:hypothetical protein